MRLLRQLIDFPGAPPVTRLQGRAPGSNQSCRHTEPVNAIHQDNTKELIEAEMDLFLEALSKNKRLFVPNCGSGMRNLLFVGEMIGVVPIQEKALQPGDIVLRRSEKLFFGGRIISGSDEDGWNIKSDCGYGPIIAAQRTEIVGIVDSFQIGDKIFPLWADHKSREISRTIASLSSRIVPIPSSSLLRSGLVLTCMRRKFYKWRLRQKQRCLKKHLCRNIRPLTFL